MDTNEQYKLNFICTHLLGKCFILDNSKDSDTERKGYYIFSTPSQINLDDAPNFLKNGLFIHDSLYSRHISDFQGVIGLYSLMEQDSSNGECRLKSNIKKIEEDDFNDYYNLFKCTSDIICSRIEDVFNESLE